MGRAVEQRFGADALYARTGIALTGLSPVVRLLWLREQQPAVRPGSIDCWRGRSYWRSASGWSHAPSHRSRVGRWAMTSVPTV